jgi:hypothetical protein
MSPLQAIATIAEQSRAPPNIAFMNPPGRCAMIEIGQIFDCSSDRIDRRAPASTF